ncbi:cobalamin-dependent protein, partial [Candidatus Bathyarchaeota archaeon]|nr:cobalamin-dependent protein [Candidatus Bathyarchaeota archaeon]
MAKPLKVTLISPPSNVEERYPKGHPLRKSTQVVEPLGLAYLAAMIEDVARVEVVDCIAESLSSVECVERVKGSDIIGISCVTSNAHIALDLAKKIKAESPHVKLILGGIHPSLYPSDMLRTKEIDVVVVGEGEYTLHELLKQWSIGEDIGSVAGIAYRRNSDIFVTPARPQEMELDRFPLPARHLLRMDLYRPFIYLRTPARAILSSRGCPFFCVYCCRDIS